MTTLCNRREQQTPATKLTARPQRAATPSNRMILTGLMYRKPGWIREGGATRPALDNVAEYDTLVIMLSISLASPVPIHDQLVAGLRGLIAAGTLEKGDELPPVRQLAADLGINLNTVARAYRELTDAGLLASTRGRGTVVIATIERPSAPRADERKRIEAGIAAAFDDAKIAGLSRDAVESMVQRQVARLWGGA
jgi:DNA-binding transcriptional regulator YhcF (GntR family)